MEFFILMISVPLFLLIVLLLSVTGWRDLDAGNRTLRRARRQRLDNLSLTQRTARHIVVVHHHGVVELIVDIHPLTTRMEDLEARASSRPCADLRVRTQPTRGGVERVHQDGIHPQAGYNREALVWRE